MNIRRTRNLLHLTFAGLIAAIVSVVAAGWLLPYEQPTVAKQGNPSPNPLSHSQSNQPTLPLLAQIKKTCLLPLRRPLYDPPPVVHVTPPKPKPQLTVKLVGIINEADHSVAMLADTRGGVKLLRVGGQMDDVGGPVKITTIESDKITIEYAGQTIELTLPTGS